MGADIARLMAAHSAFAVADLRRKEEQKRGDHLKYGAVSGGIRRNPADDGLADGQAQVMAAELAGAGLGSAAHGSVGRFSTAT